MKRKKNCRYFEEKYSEKQIRCGMDGSIRNINKCNEYCPKYAPTLTLWERIKKWFSKHFY